MPVPEELLRDLLPGPVTLVLPRSDALNADLNPFTPVGEGNGRAALLGWPVGPGRGGAELLPSASLFPSCSWWASASPTTASSGSWSGPVMGLWL